MSIALFLTGCASDAPGRLAAAGAAKAEAGLVDTAIAETGAVPDLPDDCRRREASGVREGDRLDVALVKAERALARQNARTGRCAALWDDVKEARGPR